MSKQPAPITDLLRETIIASKLPLLTLQQETGVKRASIMRFIRGEQSLRLDIADKLAAYFGLALRPIKAKKKESAPVEGQEHRRKIMEKARSEKARPILLADLERRYRESSTTPTTDGPAEKKKDR